MTGERHARTLRTFPFLIALCFVCVPVAAQYSGGSGTADDPYLIYTAEHLNALGAGPNDYDKHFKLMADIDLSKYSYDRAVIAPDVSDAEDEFQGTPFTGVFDGHGHTISHLTVAGKSYLGLFGQIYSGALICNAGLEAADVNATGDYAGALVGRSIEGIITTSYSSGTVRGNSRVGGLTGYNWHRSSITATYSTATVDGANRVGGLVGHNHGGSIASSYSAGAVRGTGSGIGGLVGANDGCVAASFWDMETSGQTASAGGVGLTTDQMQYEHTYLGSVWDLVDEPVNGTCDYWQISAGEYPRLSWHVGSRPVMPEGLGTVAEPYLIRDARDLGTMWFKPLAHYRLTAPVDLSGIAWSLPVVPWFGGGLDGNGHAISNLHIEGASYLGLFGQLGSGAKITHLGLNAADVSGTGNQVGGLAGFNRGSIADSYSDGIIRGGKSVGGLAGRNRGVITTSRATGTVSGGDYGVGGLVGSNYGSIAACYSTATVSGTESRIGGLVGWNGAGSITASYSTGSVTGGRYPGGLVGGNDWASITASFWDVETSGQSESSGGAALTTPEMQTASTFLEAGWDFVEETENGTEDIWWILEGQDYPRLWWERGDASPLQIK